MAACNVILGNLQPNGCTCYTVRVGPLYERHFGTRYFWPFFKGVSHTYTVGRSATAVKLKVNGQFEIFSKVNGQATTFL